MKIKSLNILYITTLVLLSISCKDEFEDDLVKDNHPEIPVTFTGATTEGFNPYYTISRAEGTIAITLSIPENSKTKIKEITKVIAGATGINAGNLSGTSYISASIPVNGYSVTFTTTIADFNTKVPSAAIPDVVPASPVTERAFMFLLTMEDDSQIIPVQVRIRVVPEKVITFDDNATKVAGTYTSSGLVTIKAAVGTDVTTVNVSSRYTPSGGTVKIHPIASLPVSGGFVTFSVPAKELFAPGDLQDNLAPIAAGKIKPLGAVTLLFDAVSPSGTKQNVYTATLVNALTLSAYAEKAPKTNPVTYYNDSTIYIKFTAANPVTARISNIEVFRKIGTAAEEAVPVATKNYSSTTATVTDSIAVVIPPVNTVALDEVVTYRVVLTSAISKTDQVAYSVTNKPVPMAKVRTINLWNPAALTGTRTDDWTFLKHKAVVTNSPDSIDIRLQIVGEGFNITRGAGNSSQYVLLPHSFNYQNANYSTVKAAYDAGSKVTTLSDLVFGDMFIVKVDGAPNNASQLKLVKVVGLTLDRNGDEDVLNLEYKSLD